MKEKQTQSEPLQQITRRHFFQQAGFGIGAAALSTLAQREALAQNVQRHVQHFAPKAKSVIFLFMAGGPSQLDMFDPKPLLNKYHDQPVPAELVKGERFAFIKGTPLCLGSPFKFAKYGQSGIEVSEIFPKVGGLIDDFCVLRSVHTNVPIHESALFMMNCGDLQAGRPSMGSWITYGLGTTNQNLPGFIVLCPGVPVVGPPLWNSSFLPAAFQGTHINNKQAKQ